jgi:SlyX protein
MRVDLRRDRARKKTLDPRGEIAHMAGMTQALEEQIAHLTRTVEDLSTGVAKQDVELRRLTGIFDLLAQHARDREADGGGGVILGDERPPHY